VANWKSSISSIISSTSLAGNLTSKKASSTMLDFTILKKFNVSLHPPKAPKIIEVLGILPSLIGSNETNGSATTNTSARGGIFRDKEAKFLLCFVENTSLGCVYYDEFSGAMREIELASQYHWNNLWLECDSALVVNAFINQYLIPWKLRNIWENCLHIISIMNFFVTHVYREGNCCVDSLTNIGIILNHLTIWSEIPLCIRGNFVRDGLGMNNYKFVNPRGGFGLVPSYEYHLFLLVIYLGEF